MRTRGFGFVCAILLAAFFSAGARRDTVRQEMRFGAEAAQRGLWREAEFRWQKILKDDPENAHVHNNLAVASENLGQFERARKEYEEALRLDPGSKEIRKNYESFLGLCKFIKSCREATQQPSPSPQASPVPVPHEPEPEPDATPGGS